MSFARASGERRALEPVLLWPESLSTKAGPRPGARILSGVGVLAKRSGSAVGLSLSAHSSAST